MRSPSLICNIILSEKRNYGVAMRRECAHQALEPDHLLLGRLSRRKTLWVVSKARGRNYKINYS